MKILMTVMMTMLVATSVYAECKEGAKCSADECKALGTGYALGEGDKCAKVGAPASITDCASINGSSLTPSATAPVSGTNTGASSGLKQ